MSRRVARAKGELSFFARASRRQAEMDAGRRIPPHEADRPDRPDRPDRYQIDMMDQRDQRDQRCPCGCPGAQFHDEPSLKIKTKEVIARPGQNTTGTDIVDRVFPLDLLRYQGLHHCTEEIAPVWKKDCRRWLWKCPEEPKEKGVVKQ